MKNKIKQKLLHRGRVSKNDDDFRVIFWGVILAMFIFAVSSSLASSNEVYETKPNNLYFSWLLSTVNK